MMKRNHLSHLRKAARIVALSLLAITFGASAGNNDNPVANPRVGHAHSRRWEP